MDKDIEIRVVIKDEVSLCKKCANECKREDELIGNNKTFTVRTIVDKCSFFKENSNG